MTKIVELIETLKNIEKEDNIKVRELFNSEILSNKIMLVKRVNYLAGSLLINDEGNINLEEIRKIEESGFNIFPLEMDSFGWVTGGIQTSKGVVMFG